MGAYENEVAERLVFDSGALLTVFAGDDGFCAWLGTTDEPRQRGPVRFPSCREAVDAIKRWEPGSDLFRLPGRADSYRPCKTCGKDCTHLGASSGRPCWGECECRTEWDTGYDVTLCRGHMDWLREDYYVAELGPPVTGC